MKITDKISNGENRFVEFKGDLPAKEQIAKTVIAFSNGAGGEILIGVDDNGDIAGLTDKQLNEDPDTIANIISDRCKPMIIPDIYRTTIEGKTIIAVKIYPGSLKPYHLKSSTPEQGTYIRIGASNKLADSSILRELERQRNNISYDEEPDLETPVEKFDFTKFIADFEKYTQKKLSDNDFKTLKLVTVESNHKYLTNAASIMGGLYERTIVKCARFKGCDMIEFIDRKEFGGMLYNVVEDVIAFVKNHINLHGKIEAIQRVDSYEIPIAAVREAVINAIVHRDYTIESDIKVAIFDDMIEIISPGILPNSITMEDLEEGRSEIRNRTIARIFKELNFIEQWGSGIAKIIKLCEQYGLKKPMIKEKGGFFCVEIYRPKTDRKPTENRPKKNDFSDQENMILKYLKTKHKITKIAIMDLLQVKETRAKEIISKLIDKKILVKIGNGRSSAYSLNND